MYCILFLVSRFIAMIEYQDVMVEFVNDQLKLKHRDDLENLDLEVVWWEVFPFKSNRFLFISGIYRLPWYSLADDICLEKKH